MKFIRVIKSEEKQKVKITLFYSEANPRVWTPGINNTIIPEAPEFGGLEGKNKAREWTKNWILEHGFEIAE